MVARVASIARAPARPDIRAATGVAAPWLPTMWLLGIAIVQQASVGLDCDVSWLLTVGERLLDGATLYRDILEVNPPASILMYLPAIALARAIGATPEAVTATGFFLLAAGVVVATGRLLRIRRDDGALAAAAATFALLVLPGACFAQREHLALLLTLPGIAVAVRRAEGDPPPRAVVVVAGLCEGVAIAIKPHFALAFVPLVALVAWRRRSLVAAVGVDAIAALAVLTAYALAVAVVFPAYLDVLPLLARTYLPMHEHWGMLLRGPVVVLPLALGLACAAIGGRRMPTLPLALLLAAGGFAAAALIQAKGFPNHALPATALGWLALAALLTGATHDRARRGIGLVALFLLGAVGWQDFSSVETHASLERTLLRLAPSGPSMIALSTDFGLGHPLVRHVRGEWVGRRPGLIVSANAAYLARDPGIDAAARRMLARDAEEDAAVFAEDLERKRPDVVLADGSVAPGWLARHPRVATMLAGYRLAARADGVAILLRDDIPGPGSDADERWPVNRAAIR